jgi:hypothetical protein
MSRIIAFLSFVAAAAACVPPTTLVAVRAVAPSGAGVDGAVVGARCAPEGNAAHLTAADGRASLAIRSSDPLRSCDVVVAKEGLATEELAVDCAGGACPPTEVTMKEAP